MQITVQELKRLLDGPTAPKIIDVRSGAEFQAERIKSPDVINHPLDKLDSLKITGTCYLLCQTGSRSAKAQLQLQDKGIEATTVTGGIEAWRAANYNVTASKGTFPIMRQVHIAAGCFILFGTLGSLFLTPLLIWVAVFAGAGLLLAGVSGFCGMARVLSKMPWNKA